MYPLAFSGKATWIAHVASPLPEWVGSGFFGWGTYATVTTTSLVFSNLTVDSPQIPHFPFRS